MRLGAHTFKCENFSDESIFPSNILIDEDILYHTVKSKDENNFGIYQWLQWYLVDEDITSMKYYFLHLWLLISSNFELNINSICEENALEK